MANTFSAIKRMRMTERKTTVNRMRRTRLKNQVRAMRKALEAKDAAKAGSVLGETYSMVDRAAKWGIIKKNTAARYKSRLSARLKSMSASAA
jgi:small subunit ribosomal protein S20